MSKSTWLIVPRIALTSFFAISIILDVEQSFASPQSVCATVRIRITQEAVMARTAFEAALMVDNSGADG